MILSHEIIVCCRISCSCYGFAIPIDLSFVHIAMFVFAFIMRYNVYYTHA